MRLLCRTFLVVLSAVTASGAQETPEKTERSDRIQFDLSFDYDPAELREHWEEKIQFKRIWGPIGLAGYHIYPAHDGGENRGQPRYIWSNGWGTSLWRDPVTGWPLQ